MVLRAGLAGPRAVRSAGRRTTVRGWSSPTPGSAPRSAACSATIRRVTVLPPSVLADGADSDALADALAGVTHVLYAPQVIGGHFDAELGLSTCSMRRDG